jgi:hypothetical protein
LRNLGLSNASENYKEREYDLCSAELGQLTKYAGIDRRSFWSAIQSLENSELIENHADVNGENLWKVYIYPRRNYIASYLNQKLRNQATE